MHSIRRIGVKKNLQYVSLIRQPELSKICVLRLSGYMKQNINLKTYLILVNLLEKYIGLRESIKQDNRT